LAGCTCHGRYPRRPDRTTHFPVQAGL